MATRILGLSDILGLVETAQDLFDKEDAKKIEKNLLNDSFTLIDFQKQIKQFSNSGSISQLLEMVPIKNKNKIKSFDEKKIIWMNAIINSMTLEERLNPIVINGSRRKRISMGSGRSIFEVNQLLNQFFNMKNMMKKINKNKGIFPFNLK